MRFLRAMTGRYSSKFYDKSASLIQKCVIEVTIKYMSYEKNVTFVEVLLSMVFIQC